MTSAPSSPSALAELRPPLAGRPDSAEREAPAEVVRHLFGRDSLYLVGFALQALAAPAVTPVTTRLLGPGGFGRLASALALMQVVVPLQGLGLRVGIQKAFLQPDGVARSRQVMGIACLSSLTQGGLLLATLGLWPGAIGFSHAQLLVAITVTWSITTCVTTVGMGFLRSTDALWRSNVVYLFQTVVAQLLAIGMCLVMRRSPEAYLAGLLVGQMVALGICLASVPPQAVRRHDWRWLWPLLAFSAPLIAQQLSTFVLNSSDRLVIQRLLGAVAVGRYQVSYNLAGLGVLLVSAVASVWIARLLVVDPALHSDLLREVRLRLSAVMAPVMLALAFTTPLLLRIWAPDSFRPAGLTGVTVWVSLATAPAAAVAVYFQALMIRNHTAWIAILTGASALLNVALNLALVPRFGISGSAAATLVSYGALSFSARIRTRGVVGPLPLLRRLPMALAAAASAGSGFIGIAGRAALLRSGVGLVCVLWFVLVVGTLLRGNGGPVRAVPIALEQS